MLQREAHFQTKIKSPAPKSRQVINHRLANEVGDSEDEALIMPSETLEMPSERFITILRPSRCFLMKKGLAR